MVDLKAFNEYRKRMNERILGSDNLEIKRFWALDSRAYEEGVLDERTKELLGLATSMVLKCDDCVTYHIVRCVQLGLTGHLMTESDRDSTTGGVARHFGRALQVGGQGQHLDLSMSPVDQSFQVIDVRLAGPVGIVGAAGPVVGRDEGALQMDA